MSAIRETYTIPEEFVNKLNEYSKKSMIPKSRLVTKLLKDFLENEAKKK
jgi:metal-responsive CopG/Arc/MetJ family transcriptional regulator